MNSVDSVSPAEALQNVVFEWINLLPEIKRAELIVNDWTISWDDGRLLDAICSSCFKSLGLPSCEEGAAESAQQRFERCISSFLRLGLPVTTAEALQTPSVRITYVFLLYQMFGAKVLRAARLSETHGLELEDFQEGLEEEYQRRKFQLSSDYNRLREELTNELNAEYDYLRERREQLLELFNSDGVPSALESVISDLNMENQRLSNLLNIEKLEKKALKQRFVQQFWADLPIDRLTTAKFHEAQLQINREKNRTLHDLQLKELEILDHRTLHRRKQRQNSALEQSSFISDDVDEGIEVHTQLSLLQVSNSKLNDEIANVRASLSSLATQVQALSDWRDDNIDSKSLEVTIQGMVDVILDPIKKQLQQNSVISNQPNLAIQSLEARFSDLAANLDRIQIQNEARLNDTDSNQRQPTSFVDKTVAVKAQVDGQQLTSELFSRSSSNQDLDVDQNNDQDVPLRLSKLEKDIRLQASERERKLLEEKRVALEFKKKQIAEQRLRAAQLRSISKRPKCASPSGDGAPRAKMSQTPPPRTAAPSPTMPKSIEDSPLGTLQLSPKGDAKNPLSTERLDSNPKSPTSDAPNTAPQFDILPVSPTSPTVPTPTFDASDDVSFGEPTSLDVSDFFGGTKQSRPKSKDHEERKKGPFDYDDEVPVTHFSHSGAESSASESLFGSSPQMSKQLVHSLFDDEDEEFANLFGSTASLSTARPTSDLMADIDQLLRGSKS